ncbi:hypothetical protein IFM5058_08339 [Aspergillus udagawae]|nr:hypothetical protein IFM5058_08339 [Aspergillus udagawae]
MPSFLATMAEANDIIVLHACARNPTGTDLTEPHWIEVADLVKEKNVFPIFESGYQEFATGDVQDVGPFGTSPSGCSPTDSKLPGVCVAQSFSKNVGCMVTASVLCIWLFPGESTEEAKSRLRAEDLSSVNFGESY